MRRRDPTDLTDRERDVLELLRRDFTNEQIAERFGISLDGAKYHVSQILSKLGVATREEAAAVALGERRRWWAAWPLWAKIAGAAFVASVVGGLALLAWGALRTDSKDGQDKEQIINAVLDQIAREPRNRADRSTATADLMTERQASDEIRRFLAIEGGQVMSASVTVAERMVWLVKVHGQFVGFIGIGSRGPETRQGEGLWLVLRDGSIIESAFRCDTPPC